MDRTIATAPGRGLDRWWLGQRLRLPRVFVLGLGLAGYLALPEGLAILSHTYVIAAAACSRDRVPGDKVPHRQRLDAVHTFIRIRGALARARPARPDGTHGRRRLLGGTSRRHHFAKAAPAAITPPGAPLDWVASFTRTPWCWAASGSRSPPGISSLARGLHGVRGVVRDRFAVSALAAGRPGRGAAPEVPRG